MFYGLCQMRKDNDLLKNMEKIHTTELGIIRIKRNLELETKDVVGWCKQKIKRTENFYRKGKNCMSLLIILL